MPVQKIRLYPKHEAVLRRVAKPVTTIDRQILQLIQNLKDTMRDAEGIGMAAPQIAVSQRVCIVMRNADQEEPGPIIALINPEILEAGPLEREYDGCLSLPGLQGYTRRPGTLRVRALNEAGEQVEYTFTGLDARVAHHEIDHLDGILYLDRLESLDDLFYIEEDDEGEVVLVPYLQVHPELATEKPSGVGVRPSDESTD